MWFKNGTVELARPCCFPILRGGAFYTENRFRGFSAVTSRQSIRFAGSSFRIPFDNFVALRATPALSLWAKVKVLTAHEQTAEYGYQNTKTLRKSQGSL